MMRFMLRRILDAFGGHFWPPLAMAISGGVAGSAILALYLVPAMFSYYASRDAKRLAKTHDFPLRFSFRIKVRAAFSAAHRQAGQTVFERLFEGQEFQDA